MFDTAAYGQGDLPITRQSVEGSGFSVAINEHKYKHTGIKVSIKFTPGGEVNGIIQDSSSGIVDGGVIEASDLNAEFDQLASAFLQPTFGTGQQGQT